MKGGKDVTIQGTVVSLGPSGVVVGGSTVPLTTTTGGGGLGAVILSGLGPINRPTTTAMLTSTTSTTNTSTAAISTTTTLASTASTTSTSTTATAKSTANRSVTGPLGLGWGLAGCMFLGAVVL